jgi:hypothetical protein
MLTYGCLLTLTTRVTREHNSPEQVLFFPEIGADLLALEETLSFLL